MGRILAAALIFIFMRPVCAFSPFPYGEFAVDYFVMLSGITYVLFSSGGFRRPLNTWIFNETAVATVSDVFTDQSDLICVQLLSRPLQWKKPSTRRFLASASGTSMYFGCRYISTVMWFMPFFMQAYLLIPLIDWLAERMNPAALVLAAFCLSCLLAQVVSLFFEDGAAVLVCRIGTRCSACPMFVSALFWVGRRSKPAAIGGPCCAGLVGLLSWLTGRPVAARLLARLYALGRIIPVLLSSLNIDFTLAARGRTRNFCGCWASTLPFYLFQAAPMHAIRNHFGRRFWSRGRIFWSAGLLRFGWC